MNIHKTLIPLLTLLAFCPGTDAAILLRDSFDYPDGVLTNVSTGRWRHSSGGGDEVNVVAGRVELTRAESEDVEAPLAGSPYPANSDTVLYARFTGLVTGLPTGANGNYFAHFGATQRGRIFTTTNGAAPGRFRFGIASGSGVATNTSSDLETNQIYTLVMRLGISNAQATLWVNPLAESDSSILSADVPSAASASVFAWRQDSAIAHLSVDDLVVATSFGEALSGNESPAISAIPDQQIAEGGMTGAIPFTIGDAESDADSLTVLAQLSTTGVLNASFGGSGSNRTVTLQALPNQTASTTVTLLVTDGTTTNGVSFAVTIIPALLFAEGFSYADGLLLTYGSPPWQHHSGSNGEVQVVSGRLVLSTAQTEDVNVSLPNGPFTTHSGVMLYASFLLNFTQRPGSSGDYFAHFNANSGRGRVFANSANAAPGRFRLGLANGTNSVSEQWPVDLATNADYRVVLRYDPATATSRLWVDPTDEAAGGITATDIATPAAISSFAFREATGMGTCTVDDLRIGLTFASVAQPTPRLRVQRLENALRFSWPASAAGFVLQSNVFAHTTNWHDLPLPAAVVNGENVVTNPAPPDRVFFRLRK